MKATGWNALMAGLWNEADKCSDFPLPFVRLSFLRMERENAKNFGTTGSSGGAEIDGIANPR